MPRHSTVQCDAAVASASNAAVPAQYTSAPRGVPGQQCGHTSTAPPHSAAQRSAACSAAGHAVFDGLSQVPALGACMGGSARCGVWQQVNHKARRQGSGAVRLEARQPAAKSASVKSCPAWRRVRVRSPAPPAAPMPRCTQTCTTLVHCTLCTPTREASHGDAAVHCHVHVPLARHVLHLGLQAMSVQGKVNHWVLHGAGWFREPPVARVPTFCYRLLPPACLNKARTLKSSNDLTIIS